MNLKTITFPNLLKQEHVTNFNFWVVDETFLGKNSLFIVTNLKTRAILGFALRTVQSSNIKQAIVEDDILELYDKILKDFKCSQIIHCDNNPFFTGTKIKYWSSEKGIKLSTTEGSSS